MRTLVFVSTVLSLFSVSSTETGLPAGLMAECPGMNRTTSISAATSRTLSVLIFKPSSTFFLINSEKRCKLGPGGVACAAKSLDFKRKTKVLISGYLDTSFSPLARSLTSQELDRGYNVILVEIFPVLFRPYPLAARTTKPLGNVLGQFLAGLASKGLTSDLLEIVGGSLGAHIGYYAAVKYTELTGELPARLTGLDPAGPCFRTLPPTDRFNANAAKQVDVLHTNIDGFGIADPIGHVDFYANGGEYQPSMASDFILPCFLVCSHVRAAFYWISSYNNPDKFIAVQCDSLTHARHGDCFNGPPVTNYLGPNTNFTKRGIFYLPTKEVTPYFMGKEGLKKRDFNVNDYLERVSPDKDMEL